MLKLATLLFMIFIAIFLKIVYKMNWSGVLAIITFSLGSYFLYTDTVYYLFFIAFGGLGVFKLIRQFVTKYEDVNKYSIKTFTVTMCIPLILGLFRIEELTPIIFCLLGALGIDSASGELGQAFKGKSYLLIPFKKVPIGTDGAVSLIGTLLGLLCGIIYIFGIGLILKIDYLLIILIISFLGSLIDSIIGGTLQRKGLINNNQNNLLTTILITIISAVVFLIIL